MGIYLPEETGQKEREKKKKERFREQEREQKAKEKEKDTVEKQAAFQEALEHKTEKLKNTNEEESEFVKREEENIQQTELFTEGTNLDNLPISPNAEIFLPFPAKVKSRNNFTNKKS